MKEKSITANVLATSDILGGFSQLPSDFNLDLGGDPGLGLVLLQNNFVTTNSDGDSYIWNEIGLNTQIKAAGFPLELGGTLRAFDGEISWERSTVTVNFDVDRMQQEKLAEFFGSTQSLEELTDHEYFDLSLDDKKVLVSEALFSYYQKLITSDQVLAWREELADLERQLLEQQSELSDTLTQAIPPISAEELDDLQADYTGLANTLSQLEERYQHHKEQIQEIPYQEMLRLKSKFADITAAIIETGDTKILTPDWDAPSPPIKLQSFDVGNFHLEQRDFVSSSLPVRGLSTRFEIAGLEIDVGYGRQAFTDFFLPSNGIQYWDENRANSVLNSNINWTHDKGAFSVSCLRMGVNGVPFTEGIASNRVNWVYGVSGAYHLGEKLLVETKLYQSQLTQENNNSTPGEMGVTDNFAGSFTLQYQPKSQIKIGTGYFRTGPAYVSLADPFQLLNTEGIETTAVGRFMKNRLQLDLLHRLGQPINAVGINGDWRRQQVRGRATYRASEHLRFGLRFYPNTYRLQNAEEEVNNRQDIFMGEAMTNFNLNERTLLTGQAIISNFVQGIFLQDTAVYSQTLNTNIGLTLHRLESWSVIGNILFDASGDALRLSTAVSYQMDNWQFGLSAFRNEDANTNTQYGLTGNIRGQLWSQTHCTLSLTNINNVHDHENLLASPAFAWNWVGQLSLSYHLQ
ncbi:MAG: hypothetical protein AAFP77_22925 [Bacteroidota bacterium]